jgi:hypothetical protein
MNAFAMWLAYRLSFALDSQERDFLNGDHAELGVSGFRALRDVINLVVHRQLQVWTEWRPWMTLSLTVIPLGVLLGLASQRVASVSSVPLFIYVSNWTPVFLESSGARSDMLRHAVGIGNQYMVLACWSWSAGFLLASLSRRAVPTNGLLFCMTVWLLLWGYSGGYLGVAYPRLLLSVIVLPPSVWGMRQGSRASSFPPPLRNLTLTLVSVTVVIMAVRNWGLALCVWGSPQACGEWLMQTSYEAQLGVPAIRHLPALLSTLIGPIGYLLTIYCWHCTRRRAEAP